MKRYTFGFLIVVAAMPIFGDVFIRGALNKALANTLYCQLAGCTMTGDLTLASAGKLLWSTDTNLTRNAAGIVAVNGGFAGLNGTGTAPTFAATGIGQWNTAAQSTFTLYRDNAAGTNLAAGDRIGSYRWLGRDNSTYDSEAEIQGFYNGSGTTQVGYISFFTANSGAPVERFRITETGVPLPTGSLYRVASDFTLAANTNLQTITGLSWTLPALTAGNYPFRCELLYSQATAAVADQFGIQTATYAATNVMAKANVMTSATAQTAANLPTLASTTATAIVTFTPSAITTVWNAHIDGLIENPSNASQQVVNIMAQTSNSADLVTVKRGSYCVVGF
jgi:hypothetical protein